MGLKITSYIFQEAMGKLFTDIENIVVYIDNVFIIGTGAFNEHLTTMEELLERLDKKGMQVNAENRVWTKSEVEYLGFLVTR